MWGFTRQTIDRMADSASEATVVSAVGTAGNDRDDHAALVPLPLAAPGRGGPRFVRNVPSGAGPETTAQDSGKG
jgi:hypothetical protein